MAHSFSKASTMNNRKTKLKELFGDMSDFSDEEMQPPRDRPPTPGKDIVIVPRVGTMVQRGDRETDRRVAAIATPPPPPPAKRRREGPMAPPPPDTLPEPACAATITDTNIAVPVGVGTEARPRDAAAAGTWRVPRIAEVDLQPVHHPSGLSCPRDEQWTSRSMQSTEAGNINSGSPANGGSCDSTARAACQRAAAPNAPGLNLEEGGDITVARY